MPHCIELLWACYRVWESAERSSQGNKQHFLARTVLLISPSQTQWTARSPILKYDISSPVPNKTCSINQCALKSRAKSLLYFRPQSRSLFSPISYIILGWNREKLTLPWQEREIISNNNISFSCETKYPVHSALASLMLFYNTVKYLKWSVFIKTHWRKLKRFLCYFSIYYNIL